jgi:hypothetical protein
MFIFEGGPGRGVVSLCHSIISLGSPIAIQEVRSVARLHEAEGEATVRLSCFVTCYRPPTSYPATPAPPAPLSLQFQAPVMHPTTSLTSMERMVGPGPPARQTANGAQQASTKPFRVPALNHLKKPAARSTVVLTTEQQAPTKVKPLEDARNASSLDGPVSLLPPAAALPVTTPNPTMRGSLKGKTAAGNGRNRAATQCDIDGVDPQAHSPAQDAHDITDEKARPRRLIYRLPIVPADALPSGKLDDITAILPPATVTIGVQCCN